uniref:MARVEL domain-containing protein n=1 Tax=Panagrolaimus sp. ES5 TaxID=591445 RepID=A0AC34FDC4_9BILA
MTFDFNGTQKPALNIYVNIFQQEYGPSDKSRFGIISNDKIIFSCEKCEFVESVGFISDNMRIALLGAAMALFLSNLFSSCSSIAQDIGSTCFFGIISLLVAIIVFSCYYKDIYISHENVNPMSEAQRDELKIKYDISVHDYYTYFPLPYETTFGPGFYFTLGACVLSIIAMFLACAIDISNYLKYKKGEKSEAA